jgi:tetratricopeptide (TPR) repeat protein
MQPDHVHLSPGQLNRLIDGRLNDTEAERVKAALEECEECQHRLDRNMRDRAARRFGSGDVELPELPPGTKIGGRFVIRGKVGSGGQAAVFEASHVDGRGEVRTVAVKVFDLGRLDAEGRYELFRSEILAHANLTHPNIVPIYDFGEHLWQVDVSIPPRRLAYYVMEFLPGGTLEGQLRPPRESGDGAPPPSKTDTTTGSSSANGGRPGARPFSPERAAETLETLARAMHYVHGSKGNKLVHRDLKPRNVLVAADGTLKIADFGLAWFVEKRAERRQFGPAAGTRGYKAPEQVRGESEKIDPRTDVYGLSAILYDLLTGQPPEPGTPDRQTPGRRLRVLEGICRKGLSREPIDRYQSAEELAEDLRRYRHGELTRAWPIGRLRRVAAGASLWVARNGWAFAAMLLLLVLSVGGAFTAWYYNILAEKRDVALQQEQRQRQRATGHLGRAKTAVQQMLTRVGAERLAYVPHMERVRREVLEDAVRLYQDILRDEPDDRAGRLEAAEAYRTLAGLNRMLGEFGEAEKHDREALDRVSRLAEEDPDHAGYLVEKARTTDALAELRARFGAWSEGIDLHRSALDLLGQAAARDPGLDVRPDTARAWSNLASTLSAVGRTEEAEAAYNRALGLQKELRGARPRDREIQERLAAYHYNLALILKSTGRLKDAEGAYREAVALQEGLVKQDERNAEYRHAWAVYADNLGGLLLEMKRGKEARELLASSLDALTRLTAEYPSIIDYRWELADSQVRRLQQQLITKENVDVKPLQELLAQLEELIEAYPNVPGYRERLGNIYTTLGHLGHGEQAFRQAVTLWEQLAQAFPQSPGYQDRLATAWYNLGFFHGARSRPVDAETESRKAAEIGEELVGRYPTIPAYREHLSRYYNQLGVVLKNLQRYDDADKAYHDALREQESLVKSHPDVPEYRHQLANTYHNLGILSAKKEKPKEALSSHREALKWRVGLKDGYPEVPLYRQWVALEQDAIAGDSWEAGDLEGSAKASAAALAEVQRLIDDFPEDPEFKYILTGCYTNRGNALLQDEKQFRLAEPLYRQALILLKQLAGQYPEVVRYRVELAKALLNLHFLMRKDKRPGEAAEALRQSLEVWETLVKDYPQDPAHRLMFADTATQLGNLLRQSDRCEEAVAPLLAAFQGYGELAGKFPETAVYRARVSLARQNLGVLARQFRATAERLLKEGKTKEAAEATRRADELLPISEDGSSSRPPE